MNPDLTYPLERLFLRIHQLNPNIEYPLTRDNAEIVDPQITPDGAFNTRGMLRGKPVSQTNPNPRFSLDEVQIRWNRFNLSRYLKGIVIPGNGSDYETTHDVLEALVGRYKLPMEITDINLFIVSDSASTVEIRARNDSVGYYGYAIVPFEGHEVDEIPFKGEVGTGDFINGIELAALVSLTAGTAINTYEPWLHFVDPIDNKTKFIAKKPFRRSLSWNQLNAAGIVYGKEITIGSNQYICRLIKSGLTDPMDATVGYDTEPTWGSEWNRLMYPICAPTGNATYDVFNPNGPQPGAWASYNQTDDLILLSSGGSGSYTWCQETHSLNTGFRSLRGYNGVSGVVPNTSSNASSARGWRPLLELVE